MTFTTFLFLFFALLQVGAALAMITVKNPVHAVLLLILCFIAGSGLWLLLQAEFLAIALVLVYVGAVMVLFLFVVMMLDIDMATMRSGFARYAVIGVPAALAMAGLMIYALRGDNFQSGAWLQHPADYSNTEVLAKDLFTNYLLQFELAAVVLLVAMIAAIVLTFRRRPGTRHQQVAKQVRVKAKDRVRLVKMEAEK